MSTPSISESVPRSVEIPVSGPVPELAGHIPEPPRHLVSYLGRAAARVQGTNEMYDFIPEELHAHAEQITREFDKGIEGQRLSISATKDLFKDSLGAPDPTKPYGGLVVGARRQPVHLIPKLADKLPRPTKRGSLSYSEKLTAWEHDRLSSIVNLPLAESDQMSDEELRHWTNVIHPSNVQGLRDELIHTSGERSKGNALQAEFLIKSSGVGAISPGLVAEYLGVKPSAWINQRNNKSGTVEKVVPDSVIKRLNYLLSLPDVILLKMGEVAQTTASWPLQEYEQRVSELQKTMMAVDAHKDRAGSKSNRTHISRRADPVRIAEIMADYNEKMRNKYGEQASTAERKAKTYDSTKRGPRGHRRADPMRVQAIMDAYDQRMVEQGYPRPVTNEASDTNETKPSRLSRLARPLGRLATQSLQGLRGAFAGLNPNADMAAYLDKKRAELSDDDKDELAADAKAIGRRFDKQYAGAKSGREHVKNQKSKTKNAKKEAKKLAQDEREAYADNAKFELDKARAAEKALRDQITEASKTVKNAEEHYKTESEEAKSNRNRNIGRLAIARFLEAYPKGAGVVRKLLSRAEKDGQSSDTPKKGRGPIKHVYDSEGNEQLKLW